MADIQRLLRLNDTFCARGSSRQHSCSVERSYLVISCRPDGMLGMATHRILHKTEPGKLKMELTDKKGNNTGEILFILQASGGRFAQQSGNTSSSTRGTGAGIGSGTGSGIGSGSGTGTGAGYGTSGTGTGAGYGSSGAGTGAGLTGAAAGLAGASGTIALSFWSSVIQATVPVDNVTLLQAAAQALRSAETRHMRAQQPQVLDQELLVPLVQVTLVAPLELGALQRVFVA